MKTTMKALLRLQGYIRNIGYRPALGGYEKRKLRIFNFMNLLGILTGVVVPVAGMFVKDSLPSLLWFVTFLPAVVSCFVLVANHYQRYELARVLYFTFYPLVTTLVYALNIDAGLEFFFILYGVLSVFFLGNIYNIVVSFSLSMSCYFLVSTVWKQYDYRLETEHYPLFLFNHGLAVAFIFYGLLLIRNENARYQQQTRDRNWQLRRSNLKILRQKADLTSKATLMEAQTRQLTELNSLKNKLFSVIAHDLKAPLYAVRNLFKNFLVNNLPGEQIRVMLPEVVNELTYTTGLMENLLQWAKSQMQSEEVRPQLLDIGAVTEEVLQVLRLQAEAKKLSIRSRIESPVFAYADKDMINLVLRNLLSNAIKFTPNEGTISVEAIDNCSSVEILVVDTGTGISQEGLRRLMEDSYYSTRGTVGEAGTGLGLMLCKDFLSRNGGRMQVRSEPGKGSTFAFTLPKAERKEQLQHSH